MNKNKIRWKNEKKPYLVYLLFNEGETELIGTKIKLKFKKFLILILNFESLRKVSLRKVIK